MNKKKEDRSTLIQNINTLSRKFSTHTILMHQAIAEKAGLSGTDHKYIDLLLEHGSMTAGKFAELSGLTTGAATGMIDRLEKIDLVRRERDPNDRRKVVVVLNREKAFERIGPTFSQMQNDLKEFYTAFTVAELITVEKYLRTVNEFTKEQIRKLNESE
ncbi:MAG: MarR family transcriptional regulator [Algoriphagus marincola HL-49]|uniref:MarR family transcriptional regulator n=1 Tax=Algoriphagus marincola HL-49 TaxID=1305737 RepID=A0A0P7Y430_9BACT|nr:MAG: MarR family transcriptional regulator [Algoriphagus marincola HL-49]